MGGRDIFGLLVKKFSLDARREASELERQRQLHKDRQHDDKLDETMK